MLILVTLFTVYYIIKFLSQTVKFTYHGIRNPAYVLLRLIQLLNKYVCRLQVCISHIIMADILTNFCLHMQYHTGRCTMGTIRLVNGLTGDEGTVQSCVWGTWRQICNTRWDDNAAYVTCKQLGFSSTNPRGKN